MVPDQHVCPFPCTKIFLNSVYLSDKDFYPHVVLPQKMCVFLLIKAYICSIAWVVPKECLQDTLSIFINSRSDVWSLGPCRIETLRTKIDLLLSEEENARQKIALMWKMRVEILLPRVATSLLASNQWGVRVSTRLDVKLLDRNLKTRFSCMLTNYSKFKLYKNRQNKILYFLSCKAENWQTESFVDEGLLISIKRYLQRCKRMSGKIKELRFILQCVIKREL